jgi:hypothetical protein
MSLTREATTVDTWLQWFATEKQAACRASLCTRYHLNALDAEALINTALLQVFRHWASLDHPLAYLWQTPKHAGAQQGRRRAYERRQLAVYAQQQRLHTHGAARTAQHVADALERVAPRQRLLLEWVMQGYDDVQIAAWLTTTPQAVRAQRYRLLSTLRVQGCPSGGHHHRRRGKEFF